MNLDILISDCFESLGCNMPALIMLVIGLAATYANRQRHPRAARWAMLAFAWFIGTDLIAIVWQRAGILLFFPNIMPNDPEELLSMLVLSTFEGLGYLFVLLALNAARMPHRPRTVYDEFSDDEIDIKRPGF